MQLSSLWRRRMCDALRGGFFAGIALCIFACSTPPPLRVETREERMQRESVIGEDLSKKLNPQFKFKKDSEVSAFMRKIAEKLSSASEEFRGSPVRVFMIEDRDAIWRSYGLPGGKIYLSVGIIKSLEFENELAGVMALEFAHIYLGHALSHLNQKGTGKGSSLDYFSFTEDENLNASEFAVDILYRAGYDPRGLVSLVNKLQKNRAHSPYEGGELDKLLDRVRRAIAQRAPLRNPIIRSQSFFTIQKRIKKL